ncbi:hypothetical protein AMATHDRAFT_11387 [Amanita thiersii Skay4041]|uniref:Endonuclease/exonuclease/phosphatase domain-containing protein n=1 Tax=Amanita thiersii Skay4041 TaxID=703135 RepID=A0A2A9N7C6_9AGAR|nr:hypothetical protein AMATHDRAFT_11387 [Amanita thiersii Skay4041]
MFFLFLPKVTATNPQTLTHAPSLTIFTINLNGLSNAMKCHSFHEHMKTLLLSAWLICETKSTFALSIISLPDYEMFESPAIPLEHPSYYKWGLLLGIHKCFQAISVPLPPSLNAHVVAMDIIIPSTDNVGFQHCLFGIYAPWSYPLQDDPSLSPWVFWNELQQICNNTHSSWSIIGKFNAVLLASESTSSCAFSSLASLAYSAFLRQTDATDLWLHQANSTPAFYPTFISKQSSATLDRACISSSGIPEAALSSPHLFIPYTDHHIICFTLLLLSPPHQVALPLW